MNRATSIWDFTPKTTDGELRLRPIGGDWTGSIDEAIVQMNKQYPECKMKLFEKEYSSRKYFVLNGVSQERMLQYQE